MKRIILATLIIIVSIPSIAQNKSDSASVIRIGPCSSSVNKEQPHIFLVIKNDEINIDSLGISIIEPDHIEKIEVLKDSIVTKKYNTDAGVVLIYPKRKYLKHYRQIIEKEN